MVVVFLQRMIRSRWMTRSTLNDELVIEFAYYALDHDEPMKFFDVMEEDDDDDETEKATLGTVVSAVSAGWLCPAKNESCAALEGELFAISSMLDLSPRYKKHGLNS